jgi:hypothetical protein
MLLLYCDLIGMGLMLLATLVCQVRRLLLSISLPRESDQPLSLSEYHPPASLLLTVSGLHKKR